jgi:hypothetical protein
MLFRFSIACLVSAFAAAGCSAATDAPTGHLDDQSDTTAGDSQNDATEASPATVDSTTSAPPASASASSSSSSSNDACSTEAAWNANSDLRFDGDDGMDNLADALNPLIHASAEPSLAITSHLEPHCVWEAAFSAPQAVGQIGGGSHAASTTQILRRPDGLWTTAPQTAGWMSVIDAASHRIWIPLAEITASAKYENADCSQLSARASVTIAASASTIALTTAQGPTTLGALLGKKTASSPSGWKAHLTFSADLAR